MISNRAKIGSMLSSVGWLPTKKRAKAIGGQRSLEAYILTFGSYADRRCRLQPRKANQGQRPKPTIRRWAEFFISKLHCQVVSELSVNSNWDGKRLVSILIIPETCVRFLGATAGNLPRISE
jgi:hypothetical protein